MNDIYFGCKKCKIFINAAHRWAVSTIENNGIVRREDIVDIEKILSFKEYWQCDDLNINSDLKKINEFLNIHKTHPVIYSELSFLYSDRNKEYLNWMCDVGDESELLPRYFVERMGLQSWDEVQDYLNELKIMPWWLDNYDESLDSVKVKFRELVHLTL